MDFLALVARAAEQAADQTHWADAFRHVSTYVIIAVSAGAGALAHKWHSKRKAEREE